jgi:hypothetical protein
MRFVLAEAGYDSSNHDPLRISGPIPVTPMHPGSLVLAFIAAALPATAFAGEPGFFAGLDVVGGIAAGSSGTINGGAPFAGGGVVNTVKFGKTTGIGGHIGYRFDPSASVFISYQHIQGDIGWNANFPAVGVASGFEGSAISNAVMGNVAYEFPLTTATAIRTTAGLGFTFNTLTGIAETDKATGIFLDDVADHTTIRPTAQIGAGIRHEIAPNITLGLDASIAYAGGFETGNTRRGNLGITDINPYRIDNVWRANFGASIRVAF